MFILFLPVTLLQQYPSNHDTVSSHNQHSTNEQLGPTCSINERHAAELDSQEANTGAWNDKEYEVRLQAAKNIKFWLQLKMINLNMWTRRQSICEHVDKVFVQLALKESHPVGLVLP